MKSLMRIYKLIKHFFLTCLCFFQKKYYKYSMQSQMAKELKIVAEYFHEMGTVFQHFSSGNEPF